MPINLDQRTSSTYCYRYQKIINKFSHRKIVSRIKCVLSLPSPGENNFQIRWPDDSKIFESLRKIEFKEQTIIHLP